MICRKCGREDELRFGYCFECASEGDMRLGKRTVVQHLVHSLKWLRKGDWQYFKIDVKCAWERLTRTGHYGPRSEWRDYL